MHRQRRREFVGAAADFCLSVLRQRSLLTAPLALASLTGLRSVTTLKQAIKHGKLR